MVYVAKTLSKIAGVLMSILALSSFSAEPEKKFLMGYYPNWSHYNGFTADKIRYKYYTHIFYAFYLADPNGGIRNSDPADEGNFTDLIKRAHSHGVKVILSLGGANQSQGFKLMAASKSARTKFIKNLLDICDKRGLDGVDIDWEYPVEGDTENHKKLFVEIRQAIDKHTRKLEFTSAVPPTDYWAQWSSTEGLMQLDYLNVMTYDFMGTWEKKVVPNSGMDQTKASIEYFEKRGIPRNKIIIGAAFYGKSFEGGTALGSTYTGKGSGNDGIWIWKDLIKQLQFRDYKVTWDEKTGSEYAVGNEEIIVFNGIPSSKIRGEYVAQNNLPGVMFWDMLSDTHERKQSLLIALYRGLRKSGPAGASSENSGSGAAPLPASAESQ